MRSCILHAIAQTMERRSVNYKRVFLVTFFVGFVAGYFFVSAGFYFFGSVSEYGFRGSFLDAFNPLYTWENVWLLFRH